VTKPTLAVSSAGKSLSSCSEAGFIAAMASAAGEREWWAAF
jgi:hypothetical protein